MPTDEEVDEESGDTMSAETEVSRGYVELISSDIVKSFTADKLREAVGTIIQISRPTDSMDTGQFILSSRDTLYEDDLRGLSIPYLECSSSQMYKIEVNSSMATPIDASLHIPNMKIPFRMYADPDTTQGDIYWKEYMMGGSFGGINFENLIDTSRVYYDIAIAFKIPMTYQMTQTYKFLSKTAPEPESTCTMKANYLDYNFLVQNYQDWASELSSELLIPNHHINSMKIYNDDLLDLEDVDTIKKLQMGYTKQRQNVFNYHFDTGRLYSDMDRDQYYGSHFITHTPKEEYRNAALTQQQNLIFDDHYFEWLDDAASADSMGELLESSVLKVDDKLSTFYNIEIKFDRHKYVDFDFDGTPTDDIYRRTELQHLYVDELKQPLAANTTDSMIQVTQPISSKFLEILKDVDEGTITDIPTRTQAFNYSHRHEIATMIDGVPTGVEEVDELPNTAIGLKTINFLQFLTYAYNNYDVALNDNFLFLGEPNPAHAACMASDTLYRNKNSQQLLKAIDYSFDCMNYYFHMLTQNEDAVEKYGATELDDDVIKRILKPTMKFYEVLAYKIEKIGGNPTGDSSTPNVIQKFWIYNSPEAGDQISIVDSQVKYGKNYTYKISAYALVMTHKYKYADFRLTKQIGTGQKVDPDDETETPKFCLQFYNPSTENKASQLYTTTREMSYLEDYRETALMNLGQEFANDQIDVSEYPQLADFHLMVEPCMELIEIPMYTKTVKVMDSPCNAINVIPFHFIDNSNRVGFKIGQDSYIDRTYPLSITVEDSARQQDYIKSREILSVQKITEPSQSPARYIEMYKINKKPNSFTDFAQALVSTIDLRQPNSVHNFHDYITADKIIPNIKYYYLFRLISENGMPGPLSQIIECELVNDGGYVYSLFDSVDSSEFSPDKVTTLSKVLKKVMQLEPHINQMMFDTSDMDFEKYAFEAVDDLKVGVADHLIWNRRFKIRLTSKKTGRKIDLNTGFNLRTRDLTKLSETMPPVTSDPPVTEEELPTLPPAEATPSEPDDDDGGGTVDEETTGGSDDDGGGTVDEETTDPVSDPTEEEGEEEDPLNVDDEVIDATPDLDPLVSRVRLTNLQYAFVINSGGPIRRVHDRWFATDGTYYRGFNSSDYVTGGPLADRGWSDRVKQYIEDLTLLIYEYRDIPKWTGWEHATPITRQACNSIILGLCGADALYGGPIDPPFGDELGLSYPGPSNLGSLGLGPGSTYGGVNEMVYAITRRSKLKWPE